jgi:nucleoside-diphosphate kinase
MSNEQTFIMIKPDGVQRGIVGAIFSRLERKGLQLQALKMIKIDRQLAETHYGEHQGKPFFKPLLSFITSSPVIVSVWQGENAVQIVRKLVGATRAEEAQPGTIRGDFVITTTYNVIHASDAPKTAEREINLFFKPGEIHDYPLTIKQWLVEGSD